MYMCIRISSVSPHLCMCVHVYVYMYILRESPPVPCVYMCAMGLRTRAGNVSEPALPIAKRTLWGGPGGCGRGGHAGGIAQQPRDNSHETPGQPHKGSVLHRPWDVVVACVDKDCCGARRPHGVAVIPSGYSWMDSIALNPSESSKRGVC